MNTARLTPAIYTMICSSFLWGGCTALGYFVGGAVDPSRPGKDTLQVHSVTNPGADRELHVRLTDGSEFRGKAESVEWDSGDYATRFSSWQKASGIAFPSLQDTIALLHTKGTSIGRFKGLDWNAISLEEGDIPLGDVQSVRWGETTLDGTRLRTLVEARTAPLLTTVHFRTGKGLRKVPLERIACIRDWHDGNGRLIGGIIGGAIDAAAIVAAVAFATSFNGMSFYGH